VNHGDAAPLTADGIVPASFLSRRARSHQNIYIYICFLFSGVICLGVAALSLPLLSDASPPAYVIPLRFLQTSQYLHRLRNLARVVVRLIAALGPDHQKNTLTSRPDVVIDAALHDCLGLQELILGEFVLTDIPLLEYSPF
jgi:hypothetical protein